MKDLHSSRKCAREVRVGWSPLYRIMGRWILPGSPSAELFGHSKEPQIFHPPPCWLSTEVLPCISTCLLFPDFPSSGWPLLPGRWRETLLLVGGGKISHFSQPYPSPTWGEPVGAIFQHSFILTGGSSQCHISMYFIPSC